MAPKRQRSSPLPSEHPPKRRAQDPLQESQPRIATLKNPPGQRLEGLGLPPPLNAPSQTLFPKKAPLSPRKKQQAPPSPTSSSSLSIPSDSLDDEDEKEEDAGTSHQQQHQQESYESQLPVS